LVDKSCIHLVLVINSKAQRRPLICDRHNSETHDQRPGLSLWLRLAPHAASASASNSCIDAFGSRLHLQRCRRRVDADDIDRVGYGAMHYGSNNDVGNTVNIVDGMHWMNRLESHSSETFFIPCHVLAHVCLFFCLLASLFRSDV